MSHGMHVTQKIHTVSVYQIMPLFFGAVCLHLTVGLGSGIHNESVYWSIRTLQLRKFATCIFLFLLFGCLDRCIFSNFFPNF